MAHLVPEGDLVLEFARHTGAVQAVSVISGTFMAIGPNLPFLPQLLMMMRTGRTEGFSTLVCFILLVSGIIRLFWWSLVHFETPLLWQSVLSLLFQLLLLQMCLAIRRRATKRDDAIVDTGELDMLPTGGRRLWDCRLRDWWRWTAMVDYIAVLAAFSVLLHVLCLTIGHLGWFREVLGYSSLLIEAMIGVPQLVSNQRRRSVQGLSKMMIAGWIIGDTYKVAYFVLRSAPTQFVLCGAVQIAVDTLIVLQMWFFRGRRD